MTVTIFDHVALVIPILSLVVGLVKLLLSGLTDNSDKALNAARHKSTPMKTDAQSNSLVYRLFS